MVPLITVPASSVSAARFRLRPFFLRLAASAALLVLIFRFVDLSAVFGVLRTADIPLILAGIAVHFASLFLATKRWHLFLGALIGRPIRYRAALALNLVGNFYGTVIPGGLIVGDAIKAYALRLPGDALGKVASSIVFDKLLAVGAVGCFSLFALTTLAGGGSTAALVGWVAAAAVFSVLVFGFFLFPKPFLRLAALPLALLPARIRDAASAFLAENFVLPRRIVLAGLALALVGQLVNSLGLMAFARAIGVPLPFLSSIWIYGLVLVLSVVPVTISGLGLREGAFLAAFAVAGFGSVEAIGVSVLIFAMQLIFALSGAAVALSGAWGKSERSSTSS
jgi:hypothetical protein